MSIRKERFCDFMIEEKPDSLGGQIPEPTEQCTNPAIATCFFCKKDYCRKHEGYHQVELLLEGFKQDFRKRLPCCKKCESKLPYSPDEMVLKHFERCWRAIKRNVRTEIKATRAAAQVAREKRKAKAAAKLKPKTPRTGI